MKTFRLATYSAILSFLLSIYILILANFNDVGFNLYYGWLYSILPCFGLYWLVRGMGKFGWIPLSLTGFTLFGEIFTLYFYHTPYSIHIVQLLINTTTGESADFIREALLSLPFVNTLLTFAGIAILSYAMLRWVKLPARWMHVFSWREL